MKAISLSFLAIAGVVTTSFAQYETPKAKGKAVIKTPHVQCEVCSDRVIFFLSKQHDGISSVKVDTRRKTTTVTWLNDRTTLENIKVAIANLGFDADDVEAEEYAFKRLPKDCRAHKPPPPPVEAPKN